MSITDKNNDKNQLPENPEAGIIEKCESKAGKASMPVAVLGATGMVGQQFVRMLAGHPYFDLVLLAGSKNSVGREYRRAVTWAMREALAPSAADLIVAEASTTALEASGARVVFSALPKEASVVEDALRRKGFFVFTNNSRHRQDEDVPILIPEINPQCLTLLAGKKKKYGGFISAGSNCTTAGLVMVLKPLLDLGLAAVDLTTFQAVSGAGRSGLPALDIMNNVIPHIVGEEEKIARETNKILASQLSSPDPGFNLPCRASCARVPVLEGHLESLLLEFRQPVSFRLIHERLVGFNSLPQALNLPSAPKQPLLVNDLPDRPQPLLDAWAGFPARAAGMAVSVGRIRVDGRHARLFLLVHNTVRGAAGNCLLAAELAFREGLLSQNGSLT